MKHALKSVTRHKAPIATVVDGKLILSLPHAATPIVWQMDLTKATSSALEVREKGKDAGCVLILKTARGETVEIAPFDTKDHAVEALIAVSKALGSAHGQIRPMDGGHPPHQPAAKKKNGILPVLLSLGLLAVLFGVWLSAQPRSAMQPASLNNTAASGSAASNEPGVPVSADEFLQNR